MVEVTEEVYHAYCRTHWNIRDNNGSFYRHEIQFSGLIGGEDGGFENFDEFVSDAGNPERLALREQDRQMIRQAYARLDEDERALVQALLFDGVTERRYGAMIGLSQKNVNKRKRRILAKIKKDMEI
jgi:RNA polymerase sigma factor (sigma-70 family)